MKPQDKPQFNLPIKEEAKPPPYLSLARRIINDPEELERILGLIWQDGYSRGLKDMNLMHEKIDCSNG